MAIYFFDSSALVKRYVKETGTGWVNAIVAPTMANDLWLARMTGPEVVSAIARRQRGGSIAVADAAIALGDFRHDLANQYLMVEITPALVAHAMTLAETHALRGYDAVQLAAALEVNARYRALGLPLTLVSADTELNAAATLEGLAVEDPNSHP